MGRIVLPNPINLGIIGVGHMGQYHVNICTKLLSRDNIYIFDINRKLVDRISKEFKVHSCSSYGELLEKVDAVIIVVPTSLHYEYTMMALHKGLHVLVEKPIANSLEHAYEIVNYAKSNNLVLHIGHVERFNGMVQEMRNIISNPYYFQAQRISSESRIQDVGVVLDLMVHDIDIILSFVKSKVKSISAYGESMITKFEDYALATLYFENGVIASLTASRISNYKARTMIISQEKSYIHMDYASHNLVIYRQQDSAYNILQDQVTCKEEHVVDRIFVHNDNPLRTELEYFLDEVTGSPRDETLEQHGVWDSQANLYTMDVAFQILKEIDKHHGSDKKD